MRINKIIERRQTCDMGSGFGKFELDEDVTLKEFLEYYKENIPVFIGFVISFIASLVFVFAGPIGIKNFFKNHVK